MRYEHVSTSAMHFPSFNELPIRSAPRRGVKDYASLRDSTRTDLNRHNVLTPHPLLVGSICILSSKSSSTLTRLR